MSDFWTRALTGAPAPQQQAPAPVQPQAPFQQPWWQQSAYTSPTQQPGMGVEQPGVMQHPSMTQQPQTKAVSARMNDVCPSCGSTNYFKPQGQPNAMMQCFECGYNPRFDQMAFGAGIPSDGAPPQASRQVASAHQGYSGAVVAHV